MTAVQRVFAPRAREDHTISSATLASRYAEVRAHTEALAAPLSGEDQTVQSMPDVSPTKWHRAHTTWFFETFVLAACSSSLSRVRSALRLPLQLVLRSGRCAASACRTGPVVPAGYRGDRALPATRRPGHARRDRLDGLRRRARSSSSDCITSNSTRNCCSWTSSTSSRRIRCAPRIARRKSTCATPSRHDGARIAGGLVEIGHDGTGLRVRQRVAAAPRVPRAVRDRRTDRFVRRTGSRSSTTAATTGPSSGSPTAGRSCRRSAGKHRCTGNGDGTRWQVFTLSGMHPVDPSAPVCHVSYYEADAFAHWSGRPAPDRSRVGGRRAGARECVRRRVAVDGVRVPAVPALPARPPGAVGEYNGKFMGNQQVLRGGACATPEGHVRADLPQLLPAGCPMGVQRRPTRADA